MTLGAGKYDKVCTLARLASRGKAVALIVIEGDHGSGFSVQAEEDLAKLLPVLLRRLADEIESDVS